MAEGVVFDLGYQKHEGERLGRAGAVSALLRDGLRRVLGIRRRARRKVLPIMLLSIALLPAAFFIAFGVIAGELEVVSADMFGHAYYFDLTGAVALVFIALSAAELLVPDRLHGTLQVYASRPLTTVDYLAGRAASMAILVLGFLWLPHVVLFIGRAWVSRGGFGDYVADNWSTLWQTAAASVVYFLAFAPLGLVVASVAKRPAVAAGALMGIISVSGPATEALVDSGTFQPIGLLALQHNPGFVKDWILGDSTRTWIPEKAGFDPAASLVMIILIAVGSWAVLVYRYRRLR
ncbi:hypothetical protein HQ535_16010 [bacterium]|nr:hypothetical protein [bacterium]